LHVLLVNTIKELQCTMHVALSHEDDTLK